MKELILLGIFNVLVYVLAFGVGYVKQHDVKIYIFLVCIQLAFLLFFVFHLLQATGPYPNGGNDGPNEKGLLTGICLLVQMVFLLILIVIFFVKLKSVIVWTILIGVPVAIALFFALHLIFSLIDFKGIYLTLLPRTNEKELVMENGILLTKDGKPYTGKTKYRGDDPILYKKWNTGNYDEVMYNGYSEYELGYGYKEVWRLSQYKNGRKEGKEIYYLSSDGNPKVPEWLNWKFGYTFNFGYTHYKNGRKEGKEFFKYFYPLGYETNCSVEAEYLKGELLWRKSFWNEDVDSDSNFEDCPMSAILKDRAEEMLEKGNDNYESKYYDLAKNYYLRSLELHEQIKEEYPEAYSPHEAACVLLKLGETYNQLKNYQLAERYMLSSLEIFQRLMRENPEKYQVDFACFYINIGAFYCNNEKYDEAENYFLHALEMYEKLVQEEPEEYSYNLSLILGNLGYNNAGQKNYDKAEKYYLQAISLCEEMAKKNPDDFLPRLAEIVDRLGSEVFIVKKNYEEAKKQFEHGLKIRVELAKKDDEKYEKLLVEGYGSLSWYYLFMGEYVQAEQFARQAIELDRELWIIAHLAHALLLQNRYEEALKSYRDVAWIDKQMVLNDLDELERNGVIPNERKYDVERIREMTGNEK